MTTVAELIEYLQTLRPETSVMVLVGENDHYLDYTTWESLILPEIEESGAYRDYSDTIDYCSRDEPVIWIGRQ